VLTLDTVTTSRLLWCFVVFSVGLEAGPAIKPKAPPIVVEGGTFSFTADQPVTWSMAPGSKGTIDANGIYHAPAHVEAQQSLAGCQLLPNDHIFNARIDDLPVHPKSNDWINFKDSLGRIANSGSVNYLPPGFPVNIIDSALPEQKMIFAYTPQYNGPFRIPPMPDLKVESGYYTRPFGGMDRHIVSVETDTCTIQEIYNLYPAKTNTANNCPECTSQSGVRYSNLSYTLPAGATDAAALYLSPLSLHRDEILSGNVNHALRTTLMGGFIRNTHIWPAKAEAGSNRQDAMPFGSRVRLKSSFQLASANPYTQTLVKQLKEYGLIVADIGAQWEVSTEDVDLYYDPKILDAFHEIAKNVRGSSLEVVDESSLMMNPNSGEARTGGETVIATSKSDGKTSTARVVLAGVTIGADSQYLVFQAGASAHQLKAWVNGSTDKAISWDMNPKLGTLSSSGVYTPPENVSSLQTVTITAKAHADPAVATGVMVNILPGGTIRIDNGNSSAYTDTKGNVWLPNCCTPYATVYSYAGYPWPKTPDIKLYQDDTVSWNDIPYQIFMKPGNYRITAKIAEPSNTSPGVRIIHLDSQGQLIYRDVDLFALSGVRNPIDFDLPAVVGPDGKLEFWVRHVVGEQTLLGALQITPDSGEPRVQISPLKGGTLTLSQKKQFYAARWYSKTPIQWSISPQIGSIDANGVYTAPSNPLSEDTTVTVTARSATDPKLTSSATVQIQKGIPAIRINCGGTQFTDAQGNVWAGDRDYQGGVTYREDQPIKGASPDMQVLYRDSRYGYGNSSFSYSFPLPNGVYQVKLKWAEYRTPAEVAAQKIAYKMKVAIDGQVVLNNFDPIAAAGGTQAAYDQTFQTTVSQNALHIVFSGEPGAGYVGSMINGIEIQPVQH
jgi:Malectin domain